MALSPDGRNAYLFCGDELAVLALRLPDAPP